MTSIAKNLFKSHPGTDKATFIRGGAALSVVLIHWNGFGIRNIFQENSKIDFAVERFLNMGALAPIAFFIASGFSLTCSQKKNNYKFQEFIFLRYFRLAPLLFVTLMVLFILEFNSTITKENFVSKILFVDVFNANYFYVDPLGILWSIPIEFWWSLSIPLFLYFNEKNFGKKKLRFIQLFILMFLAIPALFGNKIWIYFPWAENFPLHFILNYGFYFVLGSFIQQLNFKIILNQKFKLLILATSLIAFFLYLVFFNISDLYFVALMISIFLLIENDKTKKSLFRGIGLYFGNICYSLFLVHQVVYFISLKLPSMYLPEPIIRVVLLLIIATFSYLVIEIPCVQMSKKIISKIRI